MRRIVLLGIFFCCFVQGSASADEMVQVAPFNAIKTNGVFDVVVNVGGAQSVTFKGDPDRLKKISIKVEDGELTITGSEKNHSFTFSSDDKFVINLPTLRLFKGQGVGEVVIKNIDGDRIDLAYEGVGSMEASGKIKWLRLKGNGVGSIDTKKLIAENADVDFDGVGGVEIYASNHLNAVTHGVGSLTYFGNPHSINKLADGIGSIGPGK